MSIDPNIDSAPVRLINLSGIKGKLHIPPCQRAYRWNCKQVNDLLEDLQDFVKSSRKSFFLQVLAVNRREGEEEAFDLIDGQQRLTTLCLLDAAIRHILSGTDEKLNFELVYDPAIERSAFLHTLMTDFNSPAENDDESLDFFCLRQARQAILDWLESFASREALAAFHERMLNDIKFLWHDSTSETDASPSQRYIRLNTGRIPLADGELCRALFLVPDNHNCAEELLEPANPELNANTRELAALFRYKRQLLLGHDWDETERELWDSSLWEFIGGGSYEAPARIGLLLELHTGEHADMEGENVCFEKFYRQFQNPASPERDAGKTWTEIGKTMDRLRYWHGHNDYYHWIGYLVARFGRGKLSFLLAAARKKTESEFRELLHDEIRKSIVPDGVPPLDEWNFNNNYLACKNLLFLFNIEYSRRHQDYCPRFPFGAFNSQKNTIEHVYAQNVESLKENEDRIQWIKEHRDFIQDLDYARLCSLDRDNLLKGVSLDDFEKRKRELMERADSFIARCREGKEVHECVLVEEFGRLSGGLRKFIEHHEEDDLHGICNLALLDHNLNSHFKNSIFAIKQEKMRHLLLEGKAFIPPATVALFSRHFARRRRDEPWWTGEDKEDYRLVLLETLGEFWPELSGLQPASKGENNGV